MKAENSTADSNGFSHRNWVEKFQIAVGGLVTGIKGRPGSQRRNSFVVHVPAAVIVVILGITLRVGLASMMVLLLCVGLVLVTELINTSLESMARAVTDQANEHIRDALDIASGAVLMASLTAVVIGAIVFGWRVVEMLGW